MPKSAIGALFIFCSYATYVAGIVGFVWLLVLGQWKFVLMGLGCSVAIPCLWTFVVFPAWWILFGLVSGGSRLRPSIRAILIPIGNGWAVVVWVVFMTSLCLSHGFSNGLPILPTLFWALAVISSPLQFAAGRKDPKNPNAVFASIMLLGLADTAFFQIVVLGILGIDPLIAIVSLVIPLGGYVAISFATAWPEIANKRKRDVKAA